MATFKAGSRRMVAVTGVPACGKTTLAARLSPHLRFGLIDLSKLVEEEGLWESYDGKRDTRVVDEFRLTKRVWDLAVGDTVVDGLMSHLLSPTHILVLRCDPRILSERMKGRGYSSAKIRENIECEYSGVILYDSLKACENVLELDNTRGASLAAVRRWLARGGKDVIERQWDEEFIEVLGGL